MFAANATGNPYVDGANSFQLVMSCDDEGAETMLSALNDSELASVATAGAILKRIANDLLARRSAPAPVG